MNKVREAGHDSQSSEREALLSQTMADTFGAEVFRSNHACSGQICTLTFQSVSDVSQSQLSQLSNFDKNNTFTATDINDLGETTVRAIYIATDDPGSLAISP